MTFDQYNEEELHLEKYSSLYEEFRRCWEAAVSATDTINATRQWFADSAQACVNEAISGQVKVNDLDKYVQDQKRRMAEYLNGTWDHTLAFQQKATFIQTGECHPILPK